VWHEEMTDSAFFRSEMIFDRIEGYPSCHGATVTGLPNGDIMAAWYAGAYETAKDVAIFSSIFSKESAEWSAPKIIHDTPGYSDGNPVLLYDERDRLWLFFVTILKSNWSECRVYYKTSDDAGKTWSIVFRESARPAENLDASWIEQRAVAGGTNMYSSIFFTPVFAILIFIPPVVNGEGQNTLVCQAMK